jgi:CRISPR system Cascade subunit CasE
MTLTLSRVRLRHAPDVGALARILLSDDADERVAHTHRLVWSLFADCASRKRDFLWREDGGNTWHSTTFLVLSQRMPEDHNNLFAIEAKPFAPRLRAGQRLGFRLRASPTANVPAAGRRGQRKDPVALALSKLPASERPRRRYEVLQEEGRRWLAKQASRAGFMLPPSAPLLVDGEAHHALVRADGRPIRFPVLELEGVLEVSDPDRFVAALGHGFGRAKAFGCGLMLIRPG